MAIVGHGGTDIIRQLVGGVINVFKKKRAICTAPCDSLVLKMHYQWSFWLFLAGFLCIWHSWYHRDVITCVSHYNADTQVRLDYINICLSYPYVNDGEDKRYLLFYRWIHWTLLVLAFAFQIPRKFSKNSENPRLKKLFEDMASHLHRYDQSEKDLLDRATKYIAFNLNTHNGMFFKLIGCHLIALFVDIFVFMFLDFIFQGHFFTYGWKAYPYYRDPVNFTDHMSVAFPPFAICKITKAQMLTAKREELFGCHLTVMELYEKVFLFVWLWIIILITLTLGYIFFLCFLHFPYFKMHSLRVAKGPVAKNTSVRKTVRQVLECCKIGDVYILYRLKQHMSHARYFELMARLTEPEVLKVISEDPEERVLQNKNQEIPGRRRNLNMNVSKKMLGAHDHYIPNSSILVE